MSVVNKMLRDLQQNKPEQTLKLDDTDVSDSVSDATHDNAKPYLKRLFILLLLTAVAISFYIVNPLSDPASEQPIANLHNTVADSDNNLQSSQDESQTVANIKHEGASSNTSPLTHDTSMIEDTTSEQLSSVSSDKNVFESNSTRSQTTNAKASNSDNVILDKAKTISDTSQSTDTTQPNNALASSSDSFSSTNHSSTDNSSTDNRSTTNHLIESRSAENNSNENSSNENSPASEESTEKQLSIIKNDVKQNTNAKKVDAVATNNTKVKNLSDAQQKKQQLQLANGFIENGLFGKAEQQLSNLLSEYNDYHPAAEKLAYVFLQTNNTQALVSLLEQQIASFPGHTTYRILLARHYANQRQWQNVVHATSSDHQSNTTLMLMRTLALQQLGQHQTAIELYVNLLRQSPERGDWWIGLSVSLEAVKRYRDAHQALVKAAKDPRVTQPQHQYIAQKTQYLQGLF
ncbi:hypothetical protein [Pleionea mediterranea]|uniref:MSHA biogenesis protein MshN n=1 Tax=Pleionea mediterranea TaxID=523701 RepID=A0A316FXV3_9GAMM|nr:hypothetical protein [Pleionea mediterranea]PWK52935.1 hypothetical protein C8D97_104153 [Pleionea mediterranea]